MKKSTKWLLTGIAAAVMSMSAVTAFAEETQNGVAINETNFPDNNFRNYVSSTIDDGDGILSDSEIASVSTISVSDMDISNLKGIEYFTSLRELYCTGNQLTTLDVSSNPELKSFDCSDNQLTALDVSNNTELQFLYCKENQLTALDVSSNPELVDLRCSYNQLTALDVSSNPELKSFDCCDNQLTALDCRNNTALQGLYCYKNQLTALDVSSNPELVELYCSNNQLTALDVSSNPELKSFDCSDNQLTALDVSSNPELVELYCSNNQLTALDVSSNTALKLLFCSYNNLTSFDVSSNTALTSFMCDDNKYILTSDSLNELTKYGFDASKAISGSWIGAEYDAAENSLKNITSKEVTYAYDTGYRIVTFTLDIDIDDDNGNIVVPAAPKADKFDPSELNDEEREVFDQEIEQSQNNIFYEIDAMNHIKDLNQNDKPQGHRYNKIGKNGNYAYSLRIVQMVDNDLLKNAESFSITIYSANADKYVTITSEYCCRYLNINGTKVEADEGCSFLAIIIDNVEYEDVITFTDYTINYKK